MNKPVKINFISDISCPWCAVGWYSLRKALEGDCATEVDIQFEPFELNPNMAAEGQNIVEHIGEKYGSTPTQITESREMIRERAAEVGFDYRMTDTSRIYNTFDAHRLLYWAHSKDRHIALNDRLLKAYHSEGRNPNDYATLVELAKDVGLDADEAREVLEQGRYTDEVHQLEQRWSARGVNAVPTVVFNDSETLVGGQPPEAFEAVLKRLAAQ